VNLQCVNDDVSRARGLGALLWHALPASVEADPNSTCANIDCIRRRPLCDRDQNLDLALIGFPLEHPEVALGDCDLFVGQCAFSHAGDPLAQS